jgi:hypothetical protein
MVEKDMGDAFQARSGALRVEPAAQSQAEPPATIARCGCLACVRAQGEAEAWEPLDFRWSRMFLCAQCGNKRCPHAAFHGRKCTGSNCSEQPGSNYGADAITEVQLHDLVRRMAEEAGTARALAARLGIHEEYVNHFLRGDRAASPKLLGALGFARALSYVSASEVT